MNATMIPATSLSIATAAHARLCNAECTLKLLHAHLAENNGDVDGWCVSEALEGVLRLLDGCYVEIGSALNDLSELARSTRVAT